MRFNVRTVLFYVMPYVCVAAALLSDATGHWEPGLRIAVFELTTMAWLLIPVIASIVSEFRGRKDL
jgi:hypothetical protein